MRDVAQVLYELLSHERLANDLNLNSIKLAHKSYTQAVSLYAASCMEKLLVAIGHAFYRAEMFSLMTRHMIKS